MDVLGGSLTTGFGGDRKQLSSRQRTVIAVVVALAVIGLVAWGAWWMRHPTLFHGTYADGQVAHVQAQRPVLVGMVYSAPSGRVSSVHIDKLSPRLVRDTAGGTFAFELCTLKVSNTSMGMAAGGLGVLDPYCTSMRPAVGADFTVGGGERQQIVMVVTPARPGIIRVAGLDLTYTAGWQKGTEHVGIGTTLFVRAQPRLGG